MASIVPVSCQVASIVPVSCQVAFIVLVNAKRQLLHHSVCQVADIVFDGVLGGFDFGRDKNQ